METMQLAVTQDTVWRAIDVNVISLNNTRSVAEGTWSGLTMKTEPVLSVNSCVSGMEKCMTRVAVVRVYSSEQDEHLSAMEHGHDPRLMTRVQVVSQRCDGASGTS